MTDEKDTGDLDPSDWLASQFEETAAVPVQPPAAVPPAVPPVQPPPAVPPPAVPPPAVPPPATAPPVVPPPAAPPVQPPPAPPVYQPPAQPPLQPPPAVPPVVPPTDFPPSPTPPPPTPPTRTPPPLVSPPPPPAAGGFSWGLTPGAEGPPAPDASLPGPPEPQEPGIPAPDPFATQAMPIADLPTQALPGQDLEAKQWEPWQASPVDSALDGATEIIEAEIIGLDGPEGESNPESPIDDLFGEGQFRAYEDEPFISGPPPAGPKAPKAPVKGIELTRLQKILLWVAGALVAILVLIGLFILGKSLGGSTAPRPVASPSPTETAASTPTAVVIPAGPAAPGDYRWDDLLGGECLAPYESAWQENYTVVDCGTPHPGQMIYRGYFDDAQDAAYPGFDELTKRTALLCTAPTIINYQIAGTAQDIQVAASFAVDAAEWDAGNRTYFCFANRATGADLTASIAFPQPAMTLPPFPAP